MNLELENKTALVTGSTAGIGLAIAASLAREGATVIINGRTKRRVNDAIKQILGQYSNAKLEPLDADVSASTAVAATIKKFPKLDILINNVGIGELKPFEKISDGDWFKLIETNFMSGVRLSRFYLPLMKKQGWGRILFISSESGVNIPSNMIHYGVTKTMQIALARGLAETTTGTAVTVNSIVVGPTSTEGVNKFLANLAKKANVNLAEIEKNFFKTERPDPQTEKENTVSKSASTSSVYRVTEIIATSESSWEDAAKHAVETATKTLRDLRVAEVNKLDLVIVDGKVTAFRARVNLSFKYEGKD